MSKFKPGDRVMLTSDFDRLHAGMKGTVVENKSRAPYVEWDGFAEGHSGPFKDDRRSCWAVSEDDILSAGEPA